jgi:acetoin utilization protein AcuC
MTASTQPHYVGSEIYRHSTYGPGHPLAIPRVSTCTDLIRAMGWMDESRCLAAPQASPAQLARFHDPAYIEALQRAEATQSATPEDRARFAIGAEGNPIYKEVFRRPATSAGGVMLAARMALECGIVHVPGGGTHHARRARAAGFCYLNDPVLGLLTWLDAGLTNIVYLDIDAHHGDGVQDAFAGDPRVLTISVHEENRWPRTGLATDRAGGSARNLPVPQGLNDSEFLYLFSNAILPLIRRRAPQAIMLQCGADALEEDPLARLSLSNNAHFAVAAALRDLGRALGPALVVTGGGGYNPWTVGRCWAGVWAILNRIPIPARTTASTEAMLRRLTYNRAAGRNPPDHWFTTIQDTPRPGPVRDVVKRLADLTLADNVEEPT